MRHATPSLLYRIAKRIGRIFYRDVVDWIALIDLREAPDPSAETATEGVRATSPERIRRIMARHDVQVRRMEASDLENIVREAPHANLDELRKRLQQATGYVLYEHDRIGAWLWTSTEPRSREGMRPLFYPVHPKPNSVYIFDGFVLPHARGHGGIHLLYSRAIEEFRKNGYHFAFFTVWSGNRNMHRLARRVGFRFVGRLTYRRVLFWVRKDTSDLQQVCEPAEAPEPVAT